MRQRTVVLGCAVSALYTRSLTVAKSLLHADVHSIAVIAMHGDVCDHEALN